MTERGFAKMHKKRIVSLAVILLCLSIMGGGTLAFFTDSTTAHNVITTGRISIDLREWANEEKTQEFATIQGAMPGESFTNIVEITNDGTAPAWMRAKVATTIKNPQGLELSTDVISMDYNTDKWEYNTTDGWFYYTDNVEAGEFTEPLFTQVTFAKTMGNAYQNCTVNIDIIAQATQVDNNGNNVFEATPESWIHKPATQEAEQRRNEI